MVNVKRLRAVAIVLQNARKNGRFPLKTEQMGDFPEEVWGESLRDLNDLLSQTLSLGTRLVPDSRSKSDDNEAYQMLIRLDDTSSTFGYKAMSALAKHEPFLQDVFQCIHNWMGDNTAVTGEELRRRQALVAKVEEAVVRVVHEAVKDEPAVLDYLQDNLQEDPDFMWRVVRRVYRMKTSETQGN